MKKILKWGLIIFGILIFISIISPNKKKEIISPIIEEKAIIKSIEKKVTGVTMEQFTKIQEGMSYEEVVEILGSKGELLSSSDIAEYKTVMYQWKGTSIMGNMNAMFQNNKMVSKAQFGLE